MSSLMPCIASTLLHKANTKSKVLWGRSEKKLASERLLHLFLQGSTLNSTAGVCQHHHLLTAPQRRKPRGTVYANATLEKNHMFKIALCQTFTETKPLTEQNYIFKKNKCTHLEKLDTLCTDTARKLLGHLNTIPNLGMFVSLFPILRANRYL